MLITFPNCTGITLPMAQWSTNYICDHLTFKLPIYINIYWYVHIYMCAHYVQTTSFICDHIVDGGAQMFQTRSWASHLRDVNSKNPSDKFAIIFEILLLSHGHSSVFFLLQQLLLGNISHPPMCMFLHQTIFNGQSIGVLHFVFCKHHEITVTIPQAEVSSINIHKNLHHVFYYISVEIESQQKASVSHSGGEV